MISLIKVPDILSLLAPFVVCTVFCRWCYLNANDFSLNNLTGTKYNNSDYNFLAKYELAGTEVSLHTNPNHKLDSSALSTIPKPLRFDKLESRINFLVLDKKLLPDRMNGVSSKKVLRKKLEKAYKGGYRRLKNISVSTGTIIIN